MENVTMDKMDTIEDTIDKDTTTRDLVIYGYGKIGKAIKLLADRAKDSNLYFTSQIFTVDTNGTAQFDSISQIKDLPNDLIHIISIDTGIDIDAKSSNGFIPNTYKILELIKEITTEREREDSNDIIIIESTVEIGFYDSLKDILEIYPNLDIIISPERYNEDTTAVDGFNMCKTKLIGVNIDDSKDHNYYANILSEYIDIFSNNDINTIIAPIREVEAAKVVENAFSYLKYSFVNELQWSFGKNNIDLPMVLSLVGTKTDKNIEDIYPGLIGGGCIPIDSLYLPDIGSSIIAKVIEKEAQRIKDLFSIVINMIEKSNLKVIGLMGASYKRHSTSTKNSQYIKLLEKFNTYFIEKYKDNKEECPKIFILDHLSADTPDRYYSNESLGKFELILIGANHSIELDENVTDYKDLAIGSGVNVFDLNNLAIYKKGE